MEWLTTKPEVNRRSRDTAGSCAVLFCLFVLFYYKATAYFFFFLYLLINFFLTFKLDNPLGLESLRSSFWNILEWIHKERNSDCYFSSSFISTLLFTSTPVTDSENFVCASAYTIVWLKAFLYSCIFFPVLSFCKNMRPLIRSYQSICCVDQKPFLLLIALIVS